MFVYQEIGTSSVYLHTQKKKTIYAIFMQILCSFDILLYEKIIITNSDNHKLLILWPSFSSFPWFIGNSFFYPLTFIYFSKLARWIHNFFRFGEKYVWYDFDTIWAMLKKGEKEGRGEKGEGRR